jgi:hypothetical protein
MDVNEWMSYECSDEGASVRHILRTFTTYLFVHIHQKKIAIEIAAKIASIKLRLHSTICRVRFVFWRIKMSAGAIIHCRFVKKKFQM